MISATLATEIRQLSNMFLALREFDLKENELELEYRNLNLITKRDWKFNHEDVCKNLRLNA